MSRSEGVRIRARPVSVDARCIVSPLLDAPLFAPHIVPETGSPRQGGFCNAFGNSLTCQFTEGCVVAGLKVGHLFRREWNSIDDFNSPRSDKPRTTRHCAV